MIFPRSYYSVKMYIAHSRPHAPEEILLECVQTYIRIESVTNLSFNPRNQKAYVVSSHELGIALVVVLVLVPLPFLTM
jgi:hypothetical protein